MEETRLERVERKIDQIAADVKAIELTLAEHRGARKAIYIVASAFGALAGLAVSYFHK